MSTDRPLTTHDLVADRANDRPADGRPRERQDPSDEDALLAPGLREDYHEQWERIQAGFVDDPRRTVEEADALVAEVMRELAEGFSRERADLEDQWDRGEEIDTEALRTALQRYRAFFNRLLRA